MQYLSHVGEEGGRWATVSGIQSDLGDLAAPAPDKVRLRMSTEYTGSPFPITGVYAGTMPTTRPRRRSLTPGFL